MGKNIALITPFDIDKNWGSEVFSRYLKSALENEGYSVDVYDETLLKVRSKSEIKICFQVARKLNHNREKYSLVIANGIIGAFVRFPTVLNIYHGNYAGYFKAMGWKRGLKGFLWHSLYTFLESQTRKSKIKIAVSESTKTDLETAYWFPDIKVINNFVDTKRFSPAWEKNLLRSKYGLNQKSFYALYTGRWEYGKGIDLLKEIFSLSQDTDIQFLIATNAISEEEKEVLKAFTKVKIIENTPYQSMQEIYQISDVLVFPSLFEGCSFSIMEALSCGLPVISSEVWNAWEIKKISPPLWKYILSSKSAKVWIDTIKEIKDTPSLQQKLSQLARVFAQENYAQEKSLEWYLQIIKPLVW